MSKLLAALRGELQKRKDPDKAKMLARFFKTGKGEYGEGDVFLGITVPDSRKIAIKYKDLSLTDVKKLLQTKVHEERLIGILILVYRFLKGKESERKNIFDFYLQCAGFQQQKSTGKITQKKAAAKIGVKSEAKKGQCCINNWDLVDLSADKIVGGYLLYASNGRKESRGSKKESSRLRSNNRAILYKLAKSNNIWERRIAIIATYQFIKEKKEYKDTFAVAEILLTDKHDLIHKAVGWMLREVGKRVSQEVEEQFLKKHYHKMPRTMLRYAIEHFSPKIRLAYLSGTIE